MAGERAASGSAAHSRSSRCPGSRGCIRTRRRRRRTRCCPQRCSYTSLRRRSRMHRSGRLPKRWPIPPPHNHQILAPTRMHRSGRLPKRWPIRPPHDHQILAPTPEDRAALDGKEEQRDSAVVDPMAREATGAATGSAAHSRYSRCPGSRSSIRTRRHRRRTCRCRESCL